MNALPFGGHIWQGSVLKSTCRSLAGVRFWKCLPVSATNIVRCYHARQKHVNAHFSSRPVLERRCH